MSLSQTRDDLKAALDGVPGVTGYVKRPQQPKSGDAWPIWRGGPVDRPSGLIAHEWAIAVALPADEAAAADRIEELIPAVMQAAGPIVYVDGVQPANLNTEASPVYGLLFTTRSE